MRRERREVLDFERGRSREWDSGRIKYNDCQVALRVHLSL